MSVSSPALIFLEMHLAACWVDVPWLFRTWNISSLHGMHMWSAQCKVAVWNVSWPTMEGRALIDDSSLFLCDLGLFGGPSWFSQGVTSGVSLSPQFEVAELTGFLVANSSCLLSPQTLASTPVELEEIYYCFRLNEVFLLRMATINSLCKLNRKDFMGHKWLVGCTLGASDTELSSGLSYFISFLWGIQDLLATCHTVSYTKEV